MSISLMLSNAVGALQTNQSAISVTANNIANVNTEDYARREVHLGAAVAGGTLAGVEITEVRRIVNEFLSREILTASSDSEFYGTKALFHDRLQSMIGRPDDDTSLAGRLTNLMAQFNEVSVDPTSMPRRADLLSDIEQLANTINNLAANLQQLRTDADQQFGEKINLVNQLTTEIYDLNIKIQSSVLAGGDPSGLEDHRDSALTKLSGLLDITISREPSGRVNVSTTSGLSLVGAIRYELQYQSAGLATPQTVFPPVTLHRVSAADGSLDPNGSEMNHHLRGGELSALLQVRDFDMVEAAKSLGALSSSVIDALNSVHNDNISLPPPNSLTGINTGLPALDDHLLTGKTTLAVVGADGALVKRIDVDFTAGTYSVNGGGAIAFAGSTVADVVAGLNTALGADGSMSFANGVMSVSATNGTNGIGFMQDAVDPSQRGGRGFSHFFGLNNLMGATSPAHYETGVTVGSNHDLTGGPAEFALKSSSGQTLKEISITPGAGTSVGALLTQLNDATTGLGTYGSFSLSATGEMTFTPGGGYTGAVLISKGDATLLDDTGLSMSQYFGLGERYQMEQAMGAFVDPGIRSDNRYLGLAKLDLSPTTAVGDIVVSPSDSRGAVAFNDLQSRSFSIPAAGRIVAMTVTLGEYISTFLADSGQQAAQASIFAENNRSLFQEVSGRLANERGVSLDEELSNMMVFQQSYNAAARMVKTAQELYDALLSIA